MFIELEADDSIRKVKVVYDQKNGEIIDYKTTIIGCEVAYNPPPEPNKNMKIVDVAILVTEYAAEWLRPRTSYIENPNPVIRDLVTGFMEGEVAVLDRLPHNQKEMFISHYMQMRNASSELRYFLKNNSELNIKNFHFRNGKIVPKW